MNFSSKPDFLTPKTSREGSVTSTQSVSSFFEHTGQALEDLATAVTHRHISRRKRHCKKMSRFCCTCLPKQRRHHQVITMNPEFKDFVLHEDAEHVRISIALILPLRRFSIFECMHVLSFSSPTNSGKLGANWSKTIFWIKYSYRKSEKKSTYTYLLVRTSPSFYRWCGRELHESKSFPNTYSSSSFDLFLITEIS